MPGLTDDLRGRIAAAVTPLHGWTTPAKACRLAELILETSAEQSVEIGVFGGRGTIADGHGPRRRWDSGCVAGIDPWDVSASLDGVQRPGQRRVVVAASITRRSTQHFLTALCSTASCGVLLGHAGAIRDSRPGVCGRERDGAPSGRQPLRAGLLARGGLWAPKLAPGGYWVADDTDWATTQRALRRLVERGFELVDNQGTWRTYRKP